MKLLAIALSGVQRGLRRDHGRGNLTNVYGEAILNCHNESLCSTNIS
jgi:hypothetical protein